MLKVSKENFDKFHNGLVIDSNERFILYLFDNFPLLKKSFNFERLFSLFEIKSKKYDKNVYLLMEAEILLGEFFAEDIFFKNKIEEIMSLDSRENVMSNFLEQYKERVVGLKQTKLLKFLTNHDEVLMNEMINSKLEFLEIYGVNQCDGMSVLLGFDFKKSIYMKKLEL